jgi:NADH-quinone oxidoreductase subunit J
MRTLALVLGLALVAGVALAPAPAAAQEPPPAAAEGGDAPDEGDVTGAAPVMVDTPRGSKGQAVFFWLFSLIAVAGAIITITRRNAVSAVMFLVGTFLGIAALYALLYAHFLAVIQVLVYAGAIMVLFVFVVMILNKEEEEPWALRGLVGKIVAGLALLYFLVRLIQVLWQVPGKIPEPAQMPADFGTTRAVADTMFTSYLFPFEAVSLVLLIAVVGALVLAHPGHPNVGEEELQ